MNMEEIQHAIDNLGHEMRQTNVRSFGLKTIVHEQWCQRVETISKMVQQYDEQQRSEKKITVPPPPPGE